MEVFDLLWLTGNGLERERRMNRACKRRMEEWKTAKCTKSPGDSFDRRMSRQEGRDKTRDKVWYRMCSGETAGPVRSVAEGLRRHGRGSRGDCRLPGGLEETHAVPLGEGEQQIRPFHLIPTWGDWRQ